MTDRFDELAAQATITITPLEEEVPIQGNAMDSGDPLADQREEQRITDALYETQWAWCIVEVTATYEMFNASTNLGCCRYESEADFKQGGYYDDLCDEARESLALTLREAYVLLSPK